MPDSASSSCRPTPPASTISPIVLMSGEHHFNEITFNEVFIDDTNLLGKEGDGWRQVTAELSFERSGPERILTHRTDADRAAAGAGEPGDVDEHAAAAVGDLVARLISLRQLSVSVARALAAGESPVNEAALVKDLGTRFEQESVDLAADLLSYVDDDTAGRVAGGRNGRDRPRSRAVVHLARRHQRGASRDGRQRNGVALDGRSPEWGRLRVPAQTI